MAAAKKPSNGDLVIRQDQGRDESTCGEEVCNGGFREALFI